MVRCGSSPKGPYARPGSLCVLCGRWTVTVCPALTSSGNFCPPNCWTTSAGVGCPPPIRTSGPTTRLSGSAKAPGKFASDRAEQRASRPRGMLRPEAGGGAPAGLPARSPGVGELSDSQLDISKTETAAAAAALAIAAPVLILMHLTYARPARVGPCLSGFVRQPRVKAVAGPLLSTAPLFRLRRQENQLRSRPVRSAPRPARAPRTPPRADSDRTCETTSAER